MAHTIDHGGVDPLTYLAEHRRHLGVVHVVLSGGKAVDTPSNKVTIEVDPRDPSVLVLDAGRRGVIRLPMAAAPGQRRVLALGKDEIEFQLRPADRVLDNPNPVSTVRPPLSAQELDDLQPTALRCTSCSRTIARLAAQTTWRNLPSAHWREIADAWLCHPKGGNDFTQRYARKMKEGIWPEPGIGLVGLWEVLLDGSVASGDLVMSGSSEVSERFLCPVPFRTGRTRRSRPASPERLFASMASCTDTNALQPLSQRADERANHSLEADCGSDDRAARHSMTKSAGWRAKPGDLHVWAHCAVDVEAVIPSEADGAAIGFRFSTTGSRLRADVARVWVPTALVRSKTISDTLDAPSSCSSTCSGSLRQIGEESLGI